MSKSIGAALHGLGIDYQDRDGEAYFLCPYHDDHQVGTFSVNLETGANWCFSCGHGGSFEHLLKTIDSDMDVEQFTRGVIRRIGQDRSSRRPDTTTQINEASLALFTDPPERQLRRRNLKLADTQALGILWDPVHRSRVTRKVFPQVSDATGLAGEVLRGVSRDARRGCRRLFRVTARSEQA